MKTILNKKKYDNRRYKFKMCKKMLGMLMKIQNFLMMIAQIIKKNQLLIIQKQLGNIFQSAILKEALIYYDNKLDYKIKMKLINTFNKLAIWVRE